MHRTHRPCRFFLAIAIVLAGCGSEDAPSPQPTSTAAAEARADKDALDRLDRANERLRKRVRRERAAAAQGARAGESRGQAPRPTASTAGFEALEAQLGGTSGVALSPVGQGAAVAAYGSLTRGPAWSTMKVPVAIAALEAGSADDALVRSAITASDNAAAQALWDGLADPGAEVSGVLAEGGDTATAVQTEVVRPEYSAFGQTDWALADQQRFVAALPCLEPAAPVLALMGETISDQRWGLYSTGLPARVKGGWGPGTDGRYLVRQMGIVELGGGGQLAVSMATIPADGSFASGIANLDAIAAWAVENAGDVPPPAC